MAPVVVPEKSHKAYLTIFGQIMNLMPNTFLQANDAVTAVIDSCYSYNFSLKISNFLHLAKKQRTTYFVKDFSWFAKFPFN